MPDETENRFLRWKACYNVRDLGGLATTDGARTRRGVLIRADSVGQLTEQGRIALEAYGIRTIIDLRFGVEVRDDPSPFTDHATIVSHNLPLNPNDIAVTRSLAAQRGSAVPYPATVNVYDRVAFLDPASSPRVIDVYLDNALFRRVRW